ncbi:MAG: hypothetical protein HC824_20305 [Synechococcales cyanobacterium RM1_1_8]|nr:hypothetical protein [Synechococcales cyanobacterium RM1_1_8]
MLKLTYGNAELQLEQLPGSLEALISRRAILTARLGQKLYLETTQASFLLSRDLPGLAELEVEICREQALFCPDGLAAPVDLYPVDELSYEVALRGVWLAEHGDAHEGMFVAALSDRVEHLLYRLWTISQAKVSFLTG